ncbi:MAG: hypothetical protein ACM3PW_11195, partial [Chlamydiota bacterium]
MRIHSSLKATCIAILVYVTLAHQAFSQQSPGSSQQQPCLGIGCAAGGAQPVPTPQPQPQSQDSSESHKVSVKRVFLNLPGDQKAIWTSPFHLRVQDSFWLAPLAATTGALIGSDQNSMAREKSNADAISLSKNVSNGGVIGLAA